MEKNGWISIENQMPPDGKEVLVAFWPEHPMMDGRQIGIDKRIEPKHTSLPTSLRDRLKERNNFTRYNVTHWMPLPKKP